MNFTDTHTHLYDEAFGSAEEQDDTVRRAIAAGVTKMVIPDESVKYRSSLLALCDRWPENLCPCSGVHPEEVSADWRKDIDDVAATLERRCDIVAIGETGMDLHWSKEHAGEQEEAFRAQIDLALEHNLPLIVHARDAIVPIFRILDDYRGRGLQGVFHAFSGSVETFRNIEKYGDWYVGIGGVLTFKKASIAETVKSIPMERIVLETDSPYLTPSPHRGERNESAYIPLIGAFLATLKGISTEEVADVTSLNAKKLFFSQKK